MKKLLLVGIFSVATVVAFSQSGYKQAIGIKFPGGFSATYKNFVTSKNAIEVQATFWNKGMRIAGLYEFHFPIQGAENLQWYVGPGVHIGSWNNTNKVVYNSSTDLGIDGVIGLDYKLKNAPVNFSLDWQPSFSLLGNSGANTAFGGIAVRYTF